MQRKKYAAISRNRIKVQTRGQDASTVHSYYQGGGKKEGEKRRMGEDETRTKRIGGKKKEEGGGLHRYLPNAGLSHAVTLGEKGSIIRVYPIGLPR